MKKIVTLAETFFVPLAPHCASTLLGCRDRRGETCQDERPAEQESVWPKPKLEDGSVADY
jgi:hypothetical protein